MNDYLPSTSALHGLSTVVDLLGRASDIVTSRPRLVPDLPARFLAVELDQAANQALHLLPREWCCPAASSSTLLDPLHLLVAARDLLNSEPISHYPIGTDAVIVSVDRLVDQCVA